MSLGTRLTCPSELATCTSFCARRQEFPPLRPRRGRRPEAGPVFLSAGAKEAASSRVPQSAQNGLPTCDSAPHLGQRIGSGAPQSAQNRFPGAASAPHFVQRMFILAAIYPPNSSSSALASFRSAVSNPSVNQL
jgi:hypothetical protein